MTQVLQRSNCRSIESMKTIRECNHNRIYEDRKWGYCCCDCPAWRPRKVDFEGSTLPPLARAVRRAGR